MKILGLADGSACSTKAIDYIASHLDIFQGKNALCLLHVHLPVPRGLARSIVGTEAVNHYYDEESRAALEPAKKILQGQGIDYQADFAIGDIAEQVKEYVDKNDIELIVMGSHGHGGFKSFVMGSVAIKVLAQATVPVLIVR